MTIAEMINNSPKNKVQIALETGVSVQTLRYWELGVTEPKEENLAKLKEVLGVKE